MNIVDRKTIVAIRLLIAIIVVFVSISCLAEDIDACLDGKSMESYYGVYRIVDVSRFRDGFTKIEEAHKRIGSSMIISKNRFTLNGLTPEPAGITNPVYKLKCYYYPLVEGEVDSNRWSDFYGFGMGRKVIKVLAIHTPKDTDGYPVPRVEVISTNEIWGFDDGWIYKMLKQSKQHTSSGDESEDTHNTGYTYCKNNEDIILSCMINSKQLSVCLNKNLEMYYRYGSKTNIELELQAPGMVTTSSYPVSGEETLHFTNRNHSYIVYKKKMFNGAGVSVYRDDEMIANNDCTEYPGNHYFSAGILYEPANILELDTLNRRDYERRKEFKLRNKLISQRETHFLDSNNSTVNSQSMIDMTDASKRENRLLHKIQEDILASSQLQNKQEINEEISKWRANLREYCEQQYPEGSARFFEQISCMNSYSTQLIMALDDRLNLFQPACLPPSKANITFHTNLVTVLCKDQPSSCQTKIGKTLAGVMGDIGQCVPPWLPVMKTYYAYQIKAKGYLYQLPEEKQKTKMYLISGDMVTIQNEQSDDAGQK